jgi:hypothetical protein
MKRQLAILRAVLDESAEWLSVNPDRDWKTIQSRFENEGESFLAITLPAMHDHILECISAGRWSPSRLFKENVKGGPQFLGEFLGFIFKWDTGTVRNDIGAVLALRCIRQLLLLHSKEKALPSQTRADKAIEGFFATERELKDRRKTILSSLDSTDFIKVSDILYRDLFDQCETKLWDDNVIFKHGPGSTADGSFGSAKFKNLRSTWTTRIEKVFPCSDFGFSNLHHYLDISQDHHYAVVSPREERPMRVILVPKTQKTPRIIAMEPTALQFVQQGLLELIDESIQSSFLRGHISWRDQDRNRFLARQGSADSSLATLDLSEASDRVHVSLVNRMLRHHPLLRRAVFSCRSTRADVLGQVIRLEKFAPMGSALCFAFETLIFFSMVVASELNRKSIPVNALRRKSGYINRSFLQGISAYGDDIIVPTAGALASIDFLESFGLKVNRRKSFWTGEFRESCGGDFFRGHDVTVVRLREKIPSKRQDQKQTWSLAQFQNQLYQAGWKQSAEKVRALAPWIPTVDRDLSSGIYFLSETSSCPSRWNTSLYRSEYKVLTGVFFTPSYKAEGWDEFFRSMISLTRRHGPAGSSHVSPFDRRPELCNLRSKWISALF